jgi:Phosphodiester glycosidase
LLGFSCFVGGVFAAKDMRTTVLVSRLNNRRQWLRGAIGHAVMVLAAAVVPARAQDVPPGPLVWSAPAPGFEVVELPVLEGGREVDKLHLARIDPALFKFEVHTAPEAARELGDWMKVTGAVLIVNGSYFARDGQPATPVVSRGQGMGPKAYGTKHGAFVVGASGPAVLDLSKRRWQDAFRGATEAMVSFPILIGADGKSRAANSDPTRLANRSFIGQDGNGRIIIGTTQTGSFSLDRFAVFLGGAGLGLVRALNLDGGPPACQAASIGTFRRSICSNSETSSDAGQLRVLGQLFGQRPWGLPIVLAVFPK